MKNLTKKLVALASVATLTIVMGLTAFAAGSPIAGVTTNTKGITIKAASKTPSLSDENVAALVKKAGVTANAKVVASFDLEADAARTAGSEITLNVPSVKADSNVAVLHCVADVWQSEDCTCGEGTVTIAPQSLSPFAIVADTTTLSSGSTSSPKTGEVSTVAVVSVVALLGCAVAFTARKRA